MSTASRWVLTAAIVCIALGVSAWVGYHWWELTRRLERAGLDGWRLVFVRLLLVPGFGVLGAFLLRRLWRVRRHGAQP